MDTRTMAVAATLSLSACMPVVPLPPSIEPAPRLGMVVSTHAASWRVSRADSLAGARTRLLQQLATYVSFGWPASETRNVGVRLTGFVGLGSGGFDVFVEAPKDAYGVWDVGAGVLSQPIIQRTWGPYLSLGRPAGNGTYVWFTQGAANIESVRDSTKRWAATSLVGLRQSRRGRAFSAFVGAVLGFQDTRCGSVAFSCRPATRAYIGVSSELTPRNRPLR